VSLAAGADEDGSDEPFDLHTIEKHGAATGAGDSRVSAFDVQLPADKEGQLPGHESPGGKSRTLDASLANLSGEHASPAPAPPCLGSLPAGAARVPARG